MKLAGDRRRRERAGEDRLRAIRGNWFTVGVATYFVGMMLGVVVYVASLLLP